MMPRHRHTISSTNVSSHRRPKNLNQHRHLETGNPHDTDWGNMSWGHIVSKDMFNWQYATSSNEHALLPDKPYDGQGVFTGCWMPTATKGELAVVYSSIKQLPFHWSDPKYPRNAAGLALATSRDGGRTWTKDARNPFLAGEPESFAVTGFRDAYVAPWPAAADLRGSSRSTLYAVVSGGIKDTGPTSFLYEVTRDEPTEWTHLGPLVNLPERFQPSPHWTGNLGVNWECVNFMTLSDGDVERHFLIIGAEGDVEKEHVASHPLPSGLPPRTVRTQSWMSGELEKTAGGVQMQYRMGGLFDHGPYYAANSFEDPKTQRRIVYGWVPEEDIPSSMARSKGWNGCLAIPRELFLLRVPNVQKGVCSDLSTIASCEVLREADGSQSLITLGVRPAEEVKSWRRHCSNPQHVSAFTMFSRSSAEYKPIFWTNNTTWELKATITVQPGCDAVGFDIRHNEDRSICTTIKVSLASETISVDRSKSSRSTRINKCPDAGAFTLLSFTNGELEQLRLRVFSDGDVLEIFANDRFALATMVYTDSTAGILGGVSAFTEGRQGSATFHELSLYDAPEGNNELNGHVTDSQAEISETVLRG